MPSSGQGAGARTAGGTASLKTPAARASTPEAPNSAEDEEPKINSTTVVFLQRAYGIGRLKIEGEHFGDYEAPPMTAENYLLCFEPLARQALVNALAEGEHPEPEAQQKLEDQRCKNLGTTLAKWNAWREKVEPLVKVTLVPRNTDLRIEQTKVLYIDDKLIDVYFEFNRYYHNSESLRLASATVTVKKPDGQQPATKQQPAGVKTQTASSRTAADGVSVINAAVTSGAGGDEVRPTTQPTPNLKTFIASKEVGTRQDENLEYRYTVLDNVKDNGQKGEGEIPVTSGDLKVYYEEGPATLSWQNIEVVAAGGGSVEKFVFIQRHDQLFSPGFNEHLKKTIKNIEGMEVVGFEVKEGEVKSAKPADAQ